MWDLRLLDFNNLAEFDWTFIGIFPGHWIPDLHIFALDVRLYVRCKFFVFYVFKFDNDFLDLADLIMWLPIFNITRKW